MRSISRSEDPCKAVVNTGAVDLAERFAFVQFSHRLNTGSSDSPDVRLRLRGKGGVFGDSLRRRRGYRVGRIGAAADTRRGPKRRRSSYSFATGQEVFSKARSSMTLH
jgi:hypothetical protein